MATAKLVTVIAEAVLTERLTRLVLETGASGYTLSPARGMGSRGLRSTTVVDGDNIRLEALMGQTAAASLFDVLARDFFPHYALIAWATEVEVLRGAKFGVALLGRDIGEPNGED
jgi:hypothetical protein